MTAVDESVPASVIVATLHTSAADRLPTPPSRRRIGRLKEIVDNDLIWKDDYEQC